MKRNVIINELPDMKKAAERDLKTLPTVIYNSVIIPQEIKDIGKDRKFFVRTYGCQGNLRDGEVIEGILSILKYEKTENLEDADIIILNTCAIRENAEKKVFGEIGLLKKLKQKNPDLIFAICGCMVQQKHIVEKIIKNSDHVDLIFGTHNIYRLPELLKECYMQKERVVEVLSNQGNISEDLPSLRANNHKAWVNIMYGCNKFCTYCIVPYTRGKERSRKSCDILKEIKQLKDEGYKEVTVLGQNVNAYGKDIDDLSFAQLLEQIALIGIERIRFTTSHPYDFSDELIDVIAKYPNIMNHIHLPVQSGDDNILKLMGRGYNREKYLNLVNKIRSKIKNVALTTDIIVGFPNESLENFQNTLSLVSEVKYDGAFTFIYSPREGTPAAKMKDNVSMATKKERFNELTKLISKYQADIYKNYENKIVKVLVDGESKKNSQILSGYTEDMKLVNFVGCKNLIGKIVNVKINKAKTYTLEGEVID